MLINYRTIRGIAADYVRPAAIIRTVYVFWGRSRTGKSRRAWDEAGLDAYPKDPRTKFWCGYQDEKHVVIDEFCGGRLLINIRNRCFTFTQVARSLSGPRGS